MQVGLYTDLRNPPMNRVPWPEFYARRMDRVAEAERLGFGAFWVSEHHMFEDGYCPQPLTVLAAAAERTSRMRLGTAILLAPLRPSLQIAEEAAIVDLLSDGRLELGFGAGYQKREFAAYEANVGRRYKLLEERLIEVRRLWDEEICMPPPAQARPPLWVGAMGPRGANMAGRLGEGLLWLDPKLLEPYRRGLEEGGHAPTTARTGGVLFLILADDPEAAWPRIAPHLLYQRETYNRYAGASENQGGENLALAGPTVSPGDEPLDAESLRSTATTGVPLPPQLRVMRGEDAAKMLVDAFAGMPVEQVFVWDSIAGMPDDLSERHIELSAEHLVPALADL
jgi:alkanesulfonate monooxygenase SsuD/methylene tetrahydromethanopterin reductase-like flavin-dependent oxidoreductase (luciferase family)